MHYGPEQPTESRWNRSVYLHWLEGQAGRGRVNSAWGKGHGYDPTGGAFTTGLMGSADPYGPPTPMSVPSPQGLVSTPSASPYEGPTDIYGAPRPEGWAKAPAPGLGGLLSPAQGPVTQGFNPEHRLNPAHYNPETGENLPKMGEWDGGPMEPGEVVGQPTGGMLGGSYVAPSAGVFEGFTPDAQTRVPQDALSRGGGGQHIASSNPGSDFEDWLQGRHRGGGMGGGTYKGEMGLIQESIYAPRRGFETAGLLAGSAQGASTGARWNGGRIAVE